MVSVHLEIKKINQAIDLDLASVEDQELNNA